MAHQPPLSVNDADIEPDSEYLHTPVDLPYIPLHYRTEYPLEEVHRYGFSEDVPLEQSHWQPYASCSDTKYPPEFVHHAAFAVMDQDPRYVSEYTSPGSGYWEQYDSQIPYEDMAVASPTSAQTDPEILCYPSPQLSSFEDYSQNGHSNYEHTEWLVHRQHIYHENVGCAPFPIPVASSEGPEALGPECSSPAGSDYQPQSSYHTGTSPASVSYPGTSYRSPASPGAYQATYSPEYTHARPLVDSRRYDVCLPHASGSASPPCPYVYPKLDSLKAQVLYAPQPRAPLPIPDDAPDEPPELVPAYRVLAIPHAAPPVRMSESHRVRLGVAELDAPKRPLTLACFFCRKRKIACGSPPPGRKDRTCNQCARRKLQCTYPEASRRGIRTRMDEPISSSVSPS